MLSDNRPYIPVTRILLIVFLVLSFFGMMIYTHEDENGPLHSIQGFMTSIFSPVSAASTGVSSAVEGVGTALSDATADADTLSALKEENAELRELVVEAEEYKQRVSDLESLLNLKDTYDIDGIGASIIGRSLNSWNQTLTLNVGSADGVQSGLTVMGPAGVIGQIISVEPHTSTVLLITDPQSGVAALLQSNRAEGIVRGSLDGLLYLENIGADVNVEVGDVVLTSGLGGSYQKGLLIGTVVQIEGKQGDASRSIVVSPNQSTSLIEDVLVVFSASVSDEQIDEASSSESETVSELESDGTILNVNEEGDADGES
ncbi:MAG: rod shape-determining protein MreC [Eggerthellaceae bacterium]|nr:rod shape-determining protein MreC [Eggerthellaceae bacterium]